MKTVTQMQLKYHKQKKRRYKNQITNLWSLVLRTKKVWREKLALSLLGRELCHDFDEWENGFDKLDRLWLNWETKRKTRTKRKKRKNEARRIKGNERKLDVTSIFLYSSAPTYKRCMKLGKRSKIPVSSLRLAKIFLLRSPKGDTKVFGFHITSPGEKCASSKAIETKKEKTKVSQNIVVRNFCNGVNPFVLFSIYIPFWQIFRACDHVLFSRKKT